MIMLAQGLENNIEMDKGNGLAEIEMFDCEAPNFDPVANDAALAMIMMAQGIAKGPTDINPADVDAGDVDAEEPPIDVEEQ